MSHFADIPLISQLPVVPELPLMKFEVWTCANTSVCLSGTIYDSDFSSDKAIVYIVAHKSLPLAPTPPLARSSSGADPSAVQRGAAEGGTARALALLLRYLAAKIWRAKVKHIC